MSKSTLNKHVVVSILVVIVSGLISCSVFGQTNDFQSNRFPSILELITNCPPITDLVFKYTHGKDTPELYRFRTQSNGFYVRITKENSFKEDFSPQDIECGRWDDDYWYYAYTPPYKAGLPPPSPVLYKYQFNSNDVASIAYKYVNIYMLSRLRLFTSLGIADDSESYPLFVDDKTNITCKDIALFKGLTKEITTTAHLDYSNSLPMRMVEKITAPDEKVITQYILYGYKPDIAGGRIPAYIYGGYFTVEVMSLSFGQTDMPLPENKFTPPKLLLAMPNLTEIVQSNLTEYEYASGRLVYKAADTQSKSDSIRATQEAERALRSGLPLDQVNHADYSPARRRYILIIIFGFSAIVLIVLIRGNMKKQ